MTPELKDKFITNLIALPAMNSARFMTICGVLAMVWVGLPPDQQAAVIAHLPLPAWALPIIATIIGLAVRVWPQATLTPPVTVVTDGVPAADPVVALTQPAQPEVLPVLTEVVEAPLKLPEDKFLTAFKILYPEVSDFAVTRLQRLASKLSENAAAASAQTAALRDKFNGDPAP